MRAAANDLGRDGQHPNECNSPEISFSCGLAVDALKEQNGSTVINSPTFASLSDAGDYLASIVEAEDYCTSDVELQVTVPDSDATCENSMLNVVATDSNCVNDSNPGSHTAERQFIVKVDTQEPDVSIQFDRNGDHFVGEMPTDSTYLFIVSIVVGQIVLCYVTHSSCMFFHRLSLLLTITQMLGSLSQFL